MVCRKNNLARQLFSQDFNVDRILRGLRAMTSVDITPGDTLIILDEIQDIPEALESLKYFKEEVPEYHIAVAGSLLGISLHQDVSYPVGKVNVINIFPMNFEEFLVAKGEEEAGCCGKCCSCCVVVFLSIYKFKILVFCFGGWFISAYL